MPEALVRTHLLLIYTVQYFTFTYCTEQLHSVYCISERVVYSYAVHYVCSRAVYFMHSHHKRRSTCSDYGDRRSDGELLAARALQTLDFAALDLPQRTDPRPPPPPLALVSTYRSKNSISLPVSRITVITALRTAGLSSCLVSYRSDSLLYSTYFMLCTVQSLNSTLQSTVQLQSAFGC